jgi:regulator of protease activity HflC (stomatin/prohibitin superfamily)
VSGIEKEEKMNFKTVAVFVVVLAIVFFLFFTVRVVNIDPTEVGVEVNKIAGKINPEPLVVGYHVYNGIKTTVVKYKVAARSFPKDTEKSELESKYTLDLKTNDGQNINVDMTIIYSLNAKDVPLLHQSVGPNYEDQVLLPQVRSEARIVIGSYAAEEIYQGRVRDQIQAKIKEKLSASLSKYPAILIQDTLLRHFAFSPDFERTIEQKKLAAQQVEINKNRALAQEEEAKRQEAESRGLKLKAIQEAEGRANSVKIEADAERYKLEQEAAGQLAKYKADAEGKRLQAEALGGGQNVVALEFAKNLSSKLQIVAVPVGQNSTSIMDLNGVFKGLFSDIKPAVKE